MGASVFFQAVCLPLHLAKTEKRHHGSRGSPTSVVTFCRTVRYTRIQVLVTVDTVNTYSRPPKDFGPSEHLMTPRDGLMTAADLPKRAKIAPPWESGAQLISGPCLDSIVCLFVAYGVLTGTLGKGCVVVTDLSWHP
jgi:hypothetical protein